MAVAMTVAASKARALADKVNPHQAETAPDKAPEEAEEAPGECKT